MSKYFSIRELRAVVAAVGERTRPAWWQTNTLTDVGLRIAGRVFPRTSLTASLKTVFLVAQIDHDQRVGRSRYHLFRLPPEVESELFAAPTSPDELRQIEAAVTADLKGIMTLLETIADAEKISPAEGPVRIGTLHHLGVAKWASVCAAHYLASVETGRRCYPYFDRPEASR